MAATGTAAPVVLIAGMVTPGCDPWTRTISRLAEPGRPGAAAVTLAIVGVAFAMLVFGLCTWAGRTRSSLDAGRRR